MDRLLAAGFVLELFWLVFAVLLPREADAAIGRPAGAQDLAALAALLPAA
eukprot:SAG22_NODE_14521_length_372_cov_1.142857_1_plen_49_part_01